MQYSLLAVFASLVATAQATAIEARNDFLSCNNYHFATLSDCQALLSNDTIWNAAWTGTDNVCYYTNTARGITDGAAYNTACYRNCCVYFASPPDKGDTPDKDTTRSAAETVLGCQFEQTVSGLDYFQDAGYGVCIGDGGGCNDCFASSDFGY